ncbi:MAG: nucleotide sugar dehydrogenase [Candidatus Magasanikbacteria bacterium]
MKLLYIGAGFVGTCSAAVSASSGHEVLVYDIDEKKINMLSSGDRDQIEACLFEEGLSDLLTRNKERIEFTIDYNKVSEFLENCDAIFMCLPTPEIGETGESDLKYYNLAAEKLAENLLKRNNSEQNKYVVIINKSTVPIDMVDKTAEILESKGVKNFGVVSNPEFLVEGKAIQGSIKPDRIVVGAWNEKDFAIMKKVYERFCNSPQTKYIEVNPKEAAAAKLLANYMLFNKLAVCFDVVGRTCESFEDLGFENVRNALVTDPRIGSWGLYDSLYAGGSCFIKDARSLSHQLKQKNQNTVLVDEVYLSNKRQLKNFLERIESVSGFENKKISILGTAFKRDTNDIRNSASIEIMNYLQDKNFAEINIYDPAAMDNFKKMFPESVNIKYHSHEFEAIRNSDIIIIATDWPQFRGLADIIMSEMSNKVIIADGRRMLAHRYEDLKNSGFKVVAVGSK